MKAVLGRRDDAGLAVTVEGDDVAGLCHRGGRGLDGVVAEEASGQAGDGARAAGACEGQEPAAGQPALSRTGGCRRRGHGGGSRRLGWFRCAS